MRWASTVCVLVAACTDIGLPGNPTVGTGDLLVLDLAASAPAPASSSFYVANDRAIVRALRHPDAFNTLYLELRFPAGALASAGGRAVGVSDSVLVTVEPLAGGYGFTLSPGDLVFANLPTALLSFGRYADPTDGASRFPDVDAYLAALDIWTEVGVERWSVAQGSGPAGVDEVRATIQAPGRFRLAAVTP